jgi:hypothetical protein
MRQYSVTFFLDVAIPRRRDGVEARTVSVSMAMPTIPQLFTNIKVLPEDDFRKINSVYVDMAKLHPSVDVFLDDEDRLKYADILKMGWKNADGESA